MELARPPRSLTGLVKLNIAYRPREYTKTRRKINPSAMLARRKRGRMQRAEIEQAFYKAGLGARVPEIDRLMRASIRLLTKPVNENTLQVGSSKLGGHPDLPVGVKWPEHDGQALSFLAQIRLTDLLTMQGSEALPLWGTLWFFYDASQQTFGDQAQDCGGWSILFNNDLSARLQRVPAPTELPAASLFQACALTFHDELTLPLEPALELPDSHWSDEEQEAYEHALELLRNPADLALPHHRLLGNPDTIQDDMRLQCQLAPQNITDPDDPRVAALEAGALDWQLLLQIDTDAGAHMHWANNGMLYYWLKQADLRAWRFDQSWLILQAE